MRVASRSTSARMWLDMNTVDAAPLRELAEELADLDDAGRVESVGRLVEDQQLGLVEEGAGEGEPLEVAERQGAGSAVGVLAETEPVDRVVRSTARSSTPCSRRATSRFSRTVSSG